MAELKGYQKKYLRGLAHSLKPIVLIGQGGLTDNVLEAIEGALEIHELIKIKFNEYKDKKSKTDMLTNIEKTRGCELAGNIGHTATFFRQNSDPEKRKITIPKR
jgi:RNA-binding protein